MKNGFDNWSDVRVFLAVVRAGSTLAASKTLGLSQPTVARRIDVLEHRLGLTLFERETRGFQPTAEGRALLPAAEALEAAALGFAAAAEDIARPQVIRVTAFSANFSERANAIFSDFALLHPEITFEFLPGIKPLDLVAGEADVALRLTRQAPDPSIIRRKVSTARFALYASKSYVEAHGLPASQDDLAGHKFVTFRRPDVPPYFDAYIRDRVAPEQIVMTCSEVDLMNAAIRSGRGIGVMNVRLAEADPNVVQCYEPPEDLDADHLILISPDAWRRPEVKTFIRFFAPRYAEIYR